MNLIVRIQWKLTINQQDVFYTTPKRTLEEKVVSGAHAGLANILHYGNDFDEIYPEFEKYGLERERSLRVAIGALRGTVEGSGLVLGSFYVWSKISEYF